MVSNSSIFSWLNAQKEIKSVDQVLQQNVGFMLQMRDFMRDLAEIEKDYARKLDGLVKRYQTKREKDLKRQSSLYATFSGATIARKSTVGFGTIAGSFVDTTSGSTLHEDE